MKKILYLLFGVALLSLASCMGIDNWDDPDCSFFGTVIDSYTNEPLLSSQNDWQIRIWERSWSKQPDGATTQQDLRIKQDGTYQNTKLFAGTYDMLPYDGPFWVVDTVKKVELNKVTEQNFTVTPYLQVIDFEYDRGETNFGSEASPDIRPSLTMTCRLKAPLKSKDGVNLPNLRHVRAFLSLSTFCGNGSNSSISIGEYTGEGDGSKGIINISRSWADEQTRNGLDPNSDTSAVYKVGPLPVIHGYTYYIRMGASCSVGSNRFNYSPIVKVTIP